MPLELKEARSLRAIDHEEVKGILLPAIINADGGILWALALGAAKKEQDTVNCGHCQSTILISGIQLSQRADV